MRRVRLFSAGVAIGVGLWFAGGLVPPSNTTSQEPTAQLSPWLAAHYCEYQNCTSHGAVVDP